MPRIFAIAYSLMCYAVGVATLVYLICFIGNLYVPVSINTASAYSPELSGPSAIIWNVALVAAWGAQHTFMASPGFKGWWTKIVPVSIERSTYLLSVAAMTAVLVLLWVPMNDVLWAASEPMLRNVLLGVYLFGWVVVLLATFLINHFHLFGLQQAYQGIGDTEGKGASFKTPFLYKIVRHPMMTGMLISLWAASDLTVGRLVLNIAMTVYIWIGIHYEEKTLVADLGEQYTAYQKTTPTVIPGVKI